MMKHSQAMKSGNAMRVPVFLLLCFYPFASCSSVHPHPRNLNAVTAKWQRFLQEEEGTAIAMDPLLEPAKPLGDSQCLCLTANQLAQRLSVEDEFDPETTYGLGCRAHDSTTDECTNLGDCINKIPLPDNCDKSWCRRAWCYVDPDQCSLENAESAIWQGQNVAFSYATCGFMDSYTSNDRLNDLQNKTLRVAYNSNSGGWQGAYNEEGHFAMNGNWYGPLVDFISEAALKGGFQLEATVPPEWLQNSSKAFFGRSSFDRCIYAVALGYLDMCVAGYTITTKRASVTSFFELTADPVYLLTFAGEEQRSSWDDFVHHLKLIFTPFTYGVWAMIVLFVLPTLGLLMWMHEYGVPGSAFPKTRARQKVDQDTGEITIEQHPIAFPTQFFRAIYMGFLSFTSETYDISVISVGGKLHLLAIFSFLILVLAVYTANLAAILTTSAQSTAVETVDEALKAGYNFCANRKLALTIMKLYKIDPARFAVDPESEGGDGLPGFNCANCQGRQRAIDFMKQNHEDPSLYCDAAFVTLQELEVMHQFGYHCNKTVVGDILTFNTFGMPLASSIAAPMSAWLYKMKYEGLLTQKLNEAQPVSQCAAQSQENEGIGLTVQQLTGIWVIVFTFALGGLLAKAINYINERKFLRSSTADAPLWHYDQWGRPIPNLDLEGTSSSGDRPLVDGRRTSTFRYFSRPSHTPKVNAGSLPRNSFSHRSYPDDDDDFAYDGVNGDGGTRETERAAEEAKEERALLTSQWVGDEPVESFESHYTTGGRQQAPMERRVSC